MSAATTRPGTKPGFVEVRFPAKPAPEVLAELKAARFRWSRHSACWYGPACNLPAQYGPPPHQDDDRSWVMRDPGEDAADRWNESQGGGL